VRPASPPSARLLDLDEHLPLAAKVRAVRALGARHRRLLAAVCAGAAVLVAVSALTPQPAAPTAAPPPGGRLPASPVPDPLAAGGAVVPGEADRLAVAVRLADPAGLLLLHVGAHAEVLAGPPPEGALPSAGGASGDAAGEVLAPDAVVLAIPSAPGTAGPEAAASGAESAGGGLLAGIGAPTPAGQGAGTTAGLDGVVLLAVPPSDARRLAAAASTRSLSVAVGLPTPGKAS
jgi:hypothetical protein